ncbi:hypothetical protein OF83DRAFT_409568 [Amylostereum chailletii]|nr:hypothetical protein OF83DRAFT_409568 [Amylostereum chailletii]
MQWTHRWSLSITAMGHCLGMGYQAQNLCHQRRRSNFYTPARIVLIEHLHRHCCSMKWPIVFLRRVASVLWGQHIDSITDLPLHHLASPVSTGVDSNARAGGESTPSAERTPDMETVAHRPDISPESRLSQIVLETAQTTVPRAAELIIDILRKIVGLFTHADRLCKIFTFLVCTAFALGVGMSLVVVIVWAYENIRCGKQRPTTPISM